MSNVPSSNESDLWRAEVLAPLRASMACMQGRINEQEEALGRATRDQEHAAAKQRRADRLATEASEKAEYLERKLDVVRRAAESAGEQMEKLRAAEASARQVAQATAEEGSRTPPKRSSRRHRRCSSPHL